MEKIKCDVITCSNELKTPEEIINQKICMACRKRLTERQRVIGVCANCNRIIGIFSKPPWMLRATNNKRPLIIFAKGCRMCSNGNTDLENSWVTFKADELSESYVVSSEGKLTLRKTDLPVALTKHKGATL